MTYLWVRIDLPLADQLVQAAHAAQMAGAHWGVPDGCRLVLLQARDRDDLVRVQERCRVRGVRAAVFWEPDTAGDGGEPMGFTAVCTEPVDRSVRRWFRRDRLWRQ